MTICSEICPPNCTKQAHFKPINCRILAWRSHKSRIFYIMFFNQPFLQRTTDHGLPGNQSGSISGSNQNWQSAVIFSHHRSKQGLFKGSLYLNSEQISASVFWIRPILPLLSIDKPLSNRKFHDCMAVGG